MPMTALKAAWTVRVGLFPGEIESMKDRHKQWLYTVEDYEADSEATKGEARGEQHPEKPPTRFQVCRDEATAYWAQWNDPAIVNWAELSFTWL